MVSRRRFIAQGTASLVTSPFILTSVRPAGSAGAAPLRVRRDVMELADNDPFFQKYADAVSAMHRLPQSDGRNWWRQAKIHADFCRHGQLQFLHWHRHYLNFFELICGQLIGDPNFALPYWNWSKKSGVIPAPFFDVPALNVESWNDPGVYSSANWCCIDTVGKRGLTKGRGLLDDPARGGAFTIAAIDNIKRASSAALFRAQLETSPHNSGHTVSGATASGKTGHIGDGLSPLDPIFWLHHCMVDRLWAEWQQAGNMTTDPGTAYTGNFFDPSGATAMATAGGALNIAMLGYTYDVLQVTAQAPATPATNGTLMNSIAPEINEALKQAVTPVTLGKAASEDRSTPLVETAVKVATPGLLGEIINDRAFRDLSVDKRPTANLEGKRILAQFSDITPPEGKSSLVVNVFVNCPYLSPTTGYVDPHYAGTFSFFGSHSHDVVVDITAPVRTLAKEGRIANEQLTVQLMPLPAYIEGKSEATFQAGTVEIIAV